MRTIPLSEALILGAASQPLCHGAFFDTAKRVCALTAAVRACGRKPATSHEVIRDCFELWPWVLEQVCPPVSEVGDVAITDEADSFADEIPVMKAPALCWIISHFDCGWPLDWIADQIRLLEDHIYHMRAAGLLFEAAKERRSPNLNGGTPHGTDVAFANPAAHSGAQLVAGGRRSVRASAWALAAATRHLRG